jgi:formyltetrahydrofolate deformylase
MRVEVEHEASRDELEESLAGAVARFGADLVVDEAGRKMRTLILVSKAGHTLRALLSRQFDGTLPITIPRILANHDDLAPLASFYGVPFERHSVYPETKPQMEARIKQVVEEEQIELVVLARYMQVLSPDLCEFLSGKAINIHHSFLPGFKGANPYRQAHERGVKLIGATAHFVTSELDEGPIIDQSVTRVDHSKSPAQLREIGEDIETVTLAHAVKLFAERRILLDGIRTVIFD